ncbi:MAG: YwiC-like family protein [Ilumatobacteraceae bacterium]
MTTLAADLDQASLRSPWRAVALPTEHGGWGLTLEPVLLGLLVAPSWQGLLIGLAAFLAFLARTPLKLVAVDRRRGRWLDRSRRAVRVAGTEVLLIVGLVAAATWAAGWQWWTPAMVAMPLVAVEWSFDVRSRGRRLVPELCGAVGIAASSAAIVIAGGASATLAIGCWMVLAARSVGAIPFVRAQILQARRGVLDTRVSDLAQAAAVCVAGGAVVLDGALLPGALGVAALACVQTWWVRKPPPAVKVLGLRQMALGLAVVLATAIGVHVV